MLRVIHGIPAAETLISVKTMSVLVTSIFFFAQHSLSFVFHDDERATIKSISSALWTSFVRLAGHLIKCFFNDAASAVAVATAAAASCNSISFGHRAPTRLMTASQAERRSDVTISA